MQQWKFTQKNQVAFDLILIVGVKRKKTIEFLLNAQKKTSFISETPKFNWNIFSSIERHEYLGNTEITQYKQLSNLI